MKVIRHANQAKKYKNGQKLHAVIVQSRADYGKSRRKRKQGNLVRYRSGMILMMIHPLSTNSIIDLIKRRANVSPNVYEIYNTFTHSKR